MLRQPDAEVIVVDYNCPDGTADKVGLDYPSARVVRVKGVPGFNPSHARNCGAAAALGETLVFVDADVVIADTFTALADGLVGADVFARPRQPATPQDNSVQGTCVVHKRHFDMVQGYDEVLRDYAGEDLELYERLMTARVGSVSLDPAAFDRVIAHGHQERSRFFDKSADMGFLVGKVYRVAKDMMIRIDGSPEIQLDVRKNLYDEIVRLVANMQSMQRKELTLTINFPDTGTQGLHRVWEFSRSINLHVRLRPRAGDSADVAVDVRGIPS